MHLPCTRLKCPRYLHHLEKRPGVNEESHTDRGHPHRDAVLSFTMTFWFRQPLVHFVIGGLLLFGANAWFGTHTPSLSPEQTPIVISQEVRDHLRARISQTGPAGEAELTRLLEMWKREEALLREARRIGLDTGDPIIDRRLTQLMRFTLESEVVTPPPRDDALQSFLEENTDRYRVSPTVSFEHRFYGADPENAERALRDRAAGQPPAGGLPFLHGNEFEALPEAQVVSRFGDAFATELFNAPTGDWRGPSNSAFGVHLWRPIRRTEARLPPLESIRTRVLQDWRESEAERLLELRIDRLIQEYTPDTQDSVP